MITWVIMTAIVLASIAMSVFLMGAAIMNNPWMILVPFIFIKLAWPKKRPSSLDGTPVASLDDDPDYE